MQKNKKIVNEFINENDVKFIRLSFCDVFGVQKNVSIMPSELMRAFDRGVLFDASAIEGFCDISKGDLFLRPDPATLSSLPWRPSHGAVVRLLCDIVYPDGTPFELDGRRILKQAVSAAEAAGIACNVGAECEFYLFKMDEEGNPTNIPFDNAGYMDIAPEDKGENVRREICLTLETMGLRPERSHHEQGPGQNEIDFKYSDPLSSADNIIAFKTVVKTIAARSGLFATFDPKPIPDKSGSGMHINISPYSLKEGGNPFDAFMAGIMNRICEITAFLNPVPSSYKRLGACKAPKYVSWGAQNRSQLIRLPADTGEYARMELRSPDPLANPYLAYALLIYAGLEGVQNGLPLPPAVNKNVYAASPKALEGLKMLPGTLSEALRLAKDSAFVGKYMPQSLLKAYDQRGRLLENSLV